MPIDVPVIMLIAIAAIVVAAVAAQRAVEHAELTSGRPSDPDGRRPGPLGPFLDALDESAAAATVRSWFGTSTLTRRERAEAERVAAIARADEARRRPPGMPEAHGPKRLVVAGAAAPDAVATPRARRYRSSCWRPRSAWRWWSSWSSGSGPARAVARSCRSPPRRRRPSSRRPRRAPSRPPPRSHRRRPPLWRPPGSTCYTGAALTGRP